MKEATAESRQRVIESLISGGVCERLLFYKNKHSPKDMKSSCVHLLGEITKKQYCTRFLYLQYFYIIPSSFTYLDNHYDQLHAALVNRKPKRLDLFLCYEQSTACIGVKRESFEVSCGGW